MLLALHGHRLSRGAGVTTDHMEFVVRFMAVKQLHRAAPIIVAMALLLATFLDGWVVTNGYCTAMSCAAKLGYQ